MNLTTDLDRRWTPALSQSPKSIMVQGDPTPMGIQPALTNRLNRSSRRPINYRTVYKLRLTTGCISYQF